MRGTLFSSLVPRRDGRLVESFLSPNLVAAALGSVLVCAASLKLHFLAASASIPLHAGRAPPIGSIALVAAEALLGLWLLLARRPQPALLAVLPCFCAFFGVAAFGVMHGSPSCNCFGEWKVSPWVAASIDAAAIFGVFIARPLSRSLATTASRGSTLRWRRGLGLAMICLSIGFLFRSWPRPLGTGPLQFGRASYVTLDPEEWVGKPLPLLEHINCTESLSNGNWVVVFYSEKCNACKEALPRYREVGDLLARVRSARDSVNAHRLALVRIGPRIGNRRVGQNCGGCVDAALAEDVTWLIHLPAAIRISDGRVTGTTDVARELLAVSSRITTRADDQADLIDYPFDVAAARRQNLLRETACGPLSLIAVMRSLGMTLSAGEEASILATSEMRGTTMLQLRDLARRRGLHTLAAEVGVDALREIGAPAIVFVDQIGFAALTDYRSDAVLVARPLEAPRWMTDDQFRRSFGDPGRALLVSNLSLPTPADGSEVVHPLAGPRIEVAQSMVSVGMVYSHAWNAAIKFKNVGTSTLFVHAVRPSTGVTTAWVEAKSLEPGEATRLIVDGVRDQLGSFTQHVAVSTNDPSSPTTTVTVRGHVVEPAVFHCQSVLLDNVPAAMDRRIVVPFDVAAGADGAAFVGNVEPPGALSVEEVKVNGGARHGVAILRWLGSDNSGWSNFTLGIGASGPDAVQASIPVSVHVLPAIDVHPRFAWINDAELASEPWRRTIVLKSSLHGVGEPRLQWSDQRFSRAISANIRHRGEHVYELALSPRNVADANQLVGCAGLTATFSDGEDCTMFLAIGDRATLPVPATTPKTERGEAVTPD